MKVYLIDDALILSGANLSQEYFTNRTDRYLHIVQGGNGLVDFYAQLVDILCSHAHVYTTTTTHEPKTTPTPNVQHNNRTQQQEKEERILPQRHPQRRRRQSRKALLRDITQLFQDPNYSQHPPSSSSSSQMASAEELFNGTSTTRHKSSNNNSNSNKKQRIVAVAIPTFQAPVGFFQQQEDEDGDEHRNTMHSRSSEETLSVPSRMLLLREELRKFSATFRSLLFMNKQPKDTVDYITDVDATLNLLQQAGAFNTIDNTNNNDNTNPYNYSFQLSSAYLNPTTTLVTILRDGYTHISLLTAGRISHGFKPPPSSLATSSNSQSKKKTDPTGSRGTDWTIPAIFEELVTQCMTTLRRPHHQQQQQQTFPPPLSLPPAAVKRMEARLYHWERPHWTFHAKGIWLTENTPTPTTTTTTTNEETTTTTRSKEETEVAAVIVGSSNFNYRSVCRDMESNLILVFPPSSTSLEDTANPHTTDNTIARSFEKEWDALLASSNEQDQQQQQQRNTGDGDGDGNDDNNTPTTTRSVAVDTEQVTYLPFMWPMIRRTIPYIKTFF